MPELEGLPVQACAAGGRHSAAVSEGGDLWVWGGGRGERGLIEFGEEVEVRGVSCGYGHTMVWTDKGVWAMGDSACPRVVWWDRVCVADTFLAPTQTTTDSLGWATCCRGTSSRASQLWMGSRSTVFCARAGRRMCRSLAGQSARQTMYGIDRPSITTISRHSKQNEATSKRATCDFTPCPSLVRRRGQRDGASTRRDPRRQDSSLISPRGVGMRQHRLLRHCLFLWNDASALHAAM